MPRTNLEQLIHTARLLRPMLSDLVFVGGVVTSLLVTDEGIGAPRPTLDVDAIAEITSYAQYAAFGDRLRALGFSEDTSKGAPLCRWVQADSILDVMPLDARILGFSNQWYPEAMEAAEAKELAAGLTIRVVTAPYFLATKIEAFRGRAKGDYLTSHDLEDLIFVVDGRPGVVAEVQQQAHPVRQYLQGQIGALLATPAFLDALPGYLLPDPASQERIGIVMARLQALASA